MKHVWRKKEKDLYIGKKKPQIVSVPALKYFVMSGVGNPNGPEFQECVQALYTLSYTIRMMPKNGFVPEGYFEYTVYPLEGIWTSNEDYKAIEKKGVNKDLLVYDVMIRQPDFVDETLFNQALELASKKLNDYQKGNIRFETLEALKSVQMLHEGSYASEKDTFDVMKDHIDNLGLKRVKSEYHTEIYLRMDKADDSRNQTTLRYYIEG